MLATIYCKNRYSENKCYNEVKFQIFKLRLINSMIIDYLSIYKHLYISKAVHT